MNTFQAEPGGEPPSGQQPEPASDVPFHATSVDIASGEADVAMPHRVDADPGALVVSGQIADAIGIADATPSGTEVAVRAFRNMSPTGSDELEGLRRRVFDLLATAGTSYGVRFALDQATETEFTLGGTAYLVNREGFDQWEVYFVLRPADANWSIWRNEQPVRLLRQVHADGDHMLVLGGD